MPPPPFLRPVALAVLIALSTPGRAGDDCDSPPASWQPRSAVQALAERNGWKLERLKIDDGCYAVRGRDAEGRRFKARIEPATLQVLRIKRSEHDGQPDRDRDRERDHQRDDRAALPSPTPSSTGVPR